MTTPTLTPSEEQLFQLLAVAQDTGNAEQVEVTERALAGDRPALDACAVTILRALEHDAPTLTTAASVAEMLGLAYESDGTRLTVHIGRAGTLHCVVWSDGLRWAMGGAWRGVPDIVQTLDGLMRGMNG